MKIVLICGSLEPCKDGVGDYTRRLAGELIRQGNNAAIIALNDRFVQIVQEITQMDGEISIPCLRIPSIEKRKLKILHAKLFIDRFNPNWMSLQYVPFSFHEKGLHFSLENMLIRIAGNRKWLVMFHELWVGMEQESGARRKSLGMLQKLLIKQMLRLLRPERVFTSNEIYKYILFLIGCKASVLPLFSNIKKSLYQFIPQGYDAEYSTWVHFGTIHSGAPIHLFLHDLVKQSLRPVRLVFIGRAGEHILCWKEKCIEYSIMFMETKEIPEAEISAWLSVADYGFSTTPYLLTFKSGAVAAMLDHDLPVLSVSYDWSVRVPCLDIYHNGIFKYKPEMFTLKDIIKPNESKQSVEYIGSLFLDLMT